jgi:deoxyribodipyrimidine photolyase-related protein
MTLATQTIRLVLGDQLNPLHSWFDRIDPSNLYVMMEVRQETDYVLHHAQKVLAVLAGMRDFARHLQSKGHRVHYLRLNDENNAQSIPKNLLALIQQHTPHSLQWQAPDEYRLKAQLQGFAASLNLHAQEVSSEHFLTEPETLATLNKGKKQWLMESFYRTMRRRHNVLMTAAGTPEGDQWNFDHDNRKPWPGTPPVPTDTRPTQDHSELWVSIQACGVSSFGNPQAALFRWPLNREQALACLDDFIEHGLPYFGDFEDAMSSRQPRLFHSLLSFALNVKMIGPLEVVLRAETAWRKGQAPLAAVEGFIRQILGWREYVRGIYWAHMPGYDQGNALGHQRPLPTWFWTGNTKMRCMQLAIGQSLETAHAHHIQRLMVIGNFSLLAGLNPHALHQWYLGIYIDAFEWVEVPNTIGMSQWADGGLIATKPYVSSGAYIDRMSDYCKGCHYERKQKLGDTACPFNSLYWQFFDRHQERFSRNPRLALVYRQLRAMPDEQRVAIQEQAVFWQERLESI